MIPMLLAAKNMGSGSHRRRRTQIHCAFLVLACGLGAVIAGHEAAFGHGDVTPQAVDTSSLPKLGDEWLGENPYRTADEAVWHEAVAVGESGYTQNCARCHGLAAVSGGLAPDLRYLEAEEFGDEWYIERYRAGYTQNGVTKMPAFGELLGQEAAWAIRTYVESRPDDESMQKYAPRLRQILAQLKQADAALADLQRELAEIASYIETGSGAPVADSPALRAARLLKAGSEESVRGAIEALAIGLSVAE